MSLFKAKSQMSYLILPPYVMARYNKKCSGPLVFPLLFFWLITRFSPSVQYNDRWNVFYLCIRVCLYQKGLMRSPVPRGEKGLTLAHIRASLREMADLSSSSTNTGPFKSRTQRERHCKTYTFVTAQTNVPQTHTNLYSVSSETGQLYI